MILTNILLFNLIIKKNRGCIKMRIFDSTNGKNSSYIYLKIKIIKLILSIINIQLIIFIYKLLLNLFKF